MRVPIRYVFPDDPRLLLAIQRASREVALAALRWFLNPDEDKPVMVGKQIEYGPYPVLVALEQACEKLHKAHLALRRDRARRKKQAKTS
jgi:hypothetical protein